MWCHAPANVAFAFGTGKETPYPARRFRPWVTVACDLICASYPVTTVPTWPNFGSRTQLREGCAGVQSMCNPSKLGRNSQVCFGHRGCTASIVPGQASCRPGAEAIAEAWLSLCKSCATEQLKHANLMCQQVNTACPICTACRTSCQHQGRRQLQGAVPLTSALWKDGVGPDDTYCVCRRCAGVASTAPEPTVEPSSQHALTVDPSSWEKGWGLGVSMQPRPGPDAVSTPMQPCSSVSPCCSDACLQQLWPSLG